MSDYVTSSFVFNDQTGGDMNKTWTTPRGFQNLSVAKIKDYQIYIYIHDILIKVQSVAAYNRKIFDPLLQTQLVVSFPQNSKQNVFRIPQSWFR